MKVGKFLVHHDKQLGQSGQVFECEAEDIKEKVCVKIIQNQNAQQFNQLMEILSKQNFILNVVKIYDIIPQQEKTGKIDIYIFMEQCDCDLSVYMKIKKFQNQEIYDFLSQIISGCMNLKELNIINQDLSPKNILYKKSIFGEVLYRLKINTHLNFYKSIKEQQIYYDSEQRDIFSLGVLLEQLCFGQKPDVIQSVNHQQLQNPRLVDQGLIDLIQQMTVQDPLERISWRQLSFILMGYQYTNKNISYNSNNIQSQFARLSQQNPSFQQQNQNFSKLIIQQQIQFVKKMEGNFISESLKKPLRTDPLRQYILNLIKLQKRSSKEIRMNKMNKNDQIRNYCIGLIYLLCLFRMQCIKDLIKLNQQGKILIENNQYSQYCKISVQEQNVLEVEKKKCILKLNTRLVKIKSLDQKDPIIVEILNANQKWEEQSTEENYTFVHTLKQYQDFLLKFEKEMQSTKFNVQFQCAVYQMYYLLKDYPVNKYYDVINFMLETKSDGEMQHFLNRLPKKFYID